MAEMEWESGGGRRQKEGEGGRVIRKIFGDSFTTIIKEEQKCSWEEER